MANEIDRGRDGIGQAAVKLLFVEGKVRRFGVLHADHVIARIHVQDLAGDAPRHVGDEIGGRLADLLDGDGAPERRVVLVPLQNVAEIADAGGGQAS